jgi:hypothetical protein
MNGLYTPVIDNIETDGRDGLFAQRRIIEIQALDVFAAIKNSDNLEALLVQLDPQLLSDIEEWPHTKGFQVELRPVKSGSKRLALICIELSAIEYRDFFHSLGEDICNILTKITDPQSAIHELHSRLYRWQEFLRKNRPEGLSTDAQVGLFGELLILESLFLQELNPVVAINGWRGCKKAHQDFQYPDLALETKTTRSTIPDTIHISNIQQLDDEGINDMFLAVVWVHQNQTAGLTLSEKIDVLRSNLIDPALSLFDEGLIEVGFLDSHRELYKRQRYQLRDVRYYEIRDEFPRLTRNQITDGVKDVNYQISIDACLPYKATVESIIPKVQNIAIGQNNG